MTTLELNATIVYFAYVFGDGRRKRRQSPNSATIVASVDRALNDFLLILRVVWLYTFWRPSLFCRCPMHRPV